MSDETQRNLDRLVARLQPQSPRAEPGNLHERVPSPNGHAHPVVADDDVIEKCRGARNSAKFSDLFDQGDTSGHKGDDSAADLALISMLAFWTQDAEQLERLFSRSVLGQRDKWRKRPDYRRRTINRALAEQREVYDWGKNERYRYRYPIRESNGNAGGNEAGDAASEAPLTSISFADMEEPEKPAEVWEGFIVEGWPALIFGGTGVTKSVTAMAVAQAIADEQTKVFLGRGVITAPVMYADWELNAAVQARRAYHIARGRGRLAPPPGLRYMSTYGVARRHRKDFLTRVLAECLKHKVKVCFIDSVGLALSGNPGDFEVIIDFFEEVVASFTAEGITPVLIDHQRRLAAGEKNQSLGAYGSVWKENLARTQLQVELVTRDREAHTVTTRLRAKKTNFDELPEPVEIRTTFSENTIGLEVVEIDATARAQEETLTARDRVFNAILALEKAGPSAVRDACGTLALSTVKKEMTSLRKAGKIEDAGEYEQGGGRIVTVTVPYRGNGNGNGGESRDDDNEAAPTVSELLEAPPEWLAAQLEKCRADRERYLDPTCSAIAAVAYDDPRCRDEVRPLLEEHLSTLGL